jgi:hypothetical protein
MPDTALAAAQKKGRERYEGFIEALARRLARGRKLSEESAACLRIGDAPDLVRSLSFRRP